MNLKERFKQLFCRHAWTSEGGIHLETRYDGGMVYDCVEDHLVCNKCGKKKRSQILIKDKFEKL